MHTRNAPPFGPGCQMQRRGGSRLEHNQIPCRLRVETMQALLGMHDIHPPPGILEQRDQPVDDSL